MIGALFKFQLQVPEIVRETENKVNDHHSYVNFPLHARIIVELKF